mgnify:CR=1 FL=1
MLCFLKRKRVKSFCQRWKHIQWRRIQPSSPTRFTITFLLLLYASFPMRAIYLSLIPHLTFFFPHADQLFCSSTTSIMIPTISWWAPYTFATALKGQIHDVCTYTSIWPRLSASSTPKFITCKRTSARLVHSIYCCRYQEMMMLPVSLSGNNNFLVCSASNLLTCTSSILHPKKYEHSLHPPLEPCHYWYGKMAVSKNVLVLVTHKASPSGLLISPDVTASFWLCPHKIFSFSFSGITSKIQQKVGK